MYTSIDLGSHSIKIVVSEMVDDKFCVLASTSVRSCGIKKGLIKDKELAIESLKEAISNINKDLGIQIKKVLLNFPLYSLNTTIETGEITVNGIVTGEHVREVIKQTVESNIPSNLEVVYLEPIVFEVNSNIQVVDPKGLDTERLEVRLAVSTIDKEILYSYLELLQEAGLDVEDLVYGIVSDYTEGKNRDIDKQLGVVVNIGYGKTEVAIFNKGIMLKGKILPVGSSKIDKDISYIYKIDRGIAANLKENFACASFKYADKFDIMETVNLSGETININQLEISQVIEARLIDLLKSVKNEVNNLTNREISYIIITGGVTNLSGFAYLIEQMFDYEKIICNMTPLGIRSNVYSTCFGLIKYFNNKMKFRDIDFTMFSSEDTEKLTTRKDKVSDDEGILDKFSTYLMK